MKKLGQTLAFLVSLSLPSIAFADIPPAIEKKIKSELMLQVLPEMQQDFVKIQSIVVEEKRSATDVRYVGTITFTTLKAAKVPNCRGHVEDFLENGEPAGAASSWHCGEGE